MTRRTGVKTEGSRRGLGDVVEQALTSVGVTKERVTRWMGKDCNCKERQQRLNELGNWARQTLGGGVSNALEILGRITGGAVSEPDLVVEQNSESGDRQPAQAEETIAAGSPVQTYPGDDEAGLGGREYEASHD